MSKKPGPHVSNRPLQTKTQRDKMRGRAFAYARGLMLGDGNPWGAPPYSHIDAETIAQWAWKAGYVAALRDVRKGIVTP